MYSVNKESKNAYTRTPLTFLVDNRDEGTACSHIKEPTCGSCLIENDAKAGKDCMGECFGYAVKDSCEICTGGTSAIEYDTSLDCANVCQGKATLDVCKICSGGTTKRKPITDKAACIVHCANGQILDDCGICGGLNKLKDCDGVCFGSNTKCFEPNRNNDGNNENDPYADDSNNSDFVIVFAGAFLMSFGLIVYYTLKYRQQMNNQVHGRHHDRERGLLRGGVTSEELNSMHTWKYKGRNEDGVEDTNLKFGNVTCSICISEYSRDETLRRRMLLNLLPFFLISSIFCLTF